MNSDIFYQNEIEYAKAFLKSDCYDFVIIGDENDYFYETLKAVFENHQANASAGKCVIVSLCGRSNKEEIMQRAEELISRVKCETCIVCDDNVLPCDKNFTVSEREYLCLVQDKNVAEKTAQFQKTTPANLLIFDEIIGPGCKDGKLFRPAGDKITASDEDTHEVYGYTYIRDALQSVILALTRLKKGNVYNVSSFKASDYEVKQSVYSLFSERFSFECSVSARGEKKIRALCPMKIKNEGFCPTDMKSALYMTVSSFLGLEYDYAKNLGQYCSKLDLLKKTELEILKEIDRICKKNDIKYFLTGGSLLGAVRYGGSIPWDDDLDIGMLREDFEKFRKICPLELDGAKYAYASYTTEENCHYLFDKIRLRNTYFSTCFSSGYKIQDGVFVDVFVYDTTSPQRKKQSLHINLVKAAIRFINLRWTGKADSSMNGYRLTRLIKPFVMRVPFKSLHSFSDKMLKLYNGKASDYLIDGTGLNINRGAFKKSFLATLTEIDFEGMSVPIPEKYHEFLTHVYGENYLAEPPLYKRTGTHDFVRLDLGEYITDNWEINKQQSLDGELF